MRVGFGASTIDKGAQRPHCSDGDTLDGKLGLRLLKLNLGFLQTLAVRRLQQIS